MTALQKMFQTSGVSGEGICPSTDDGELLDELKPLYKNGFHLSKKRLAVGYQFAGGSCTATEFRRMPHPIALLEVVGHHQQGSKVYLVYSEVVFSSINLHISTNNGKLGQPPMTWQLEVAFA